MTTAPLSPPPAAQTAVLNVRGLPPPEPMQRVLEALAGLPPRTTLVVHIHREPVFLYELLGPDGWRRSARQLAPDHWEISIWRAEDAG